MNFTHFKSTRKKVPVKDLVFGFRGNLAISDPVKRGLNYRFDDTMNLDAMDVSIISAGRVNDPLWIVAETNQVLRGNRRAASCARLLANPNTPQALIAEITKLECIAFEGLTEAEKTAIILDQGSTQEFYKAETILGCWDLDNQCVPFAGIVEQMYMNLARFTNRMDKLKDVPPLAAKNEREKFLKNWFRGTLDQHILYANRMGPIVREQYLLSYKGIDKILKDDEKITINLAKAGGYGDRIPDLWKAKTADGKDWTYAKGGPEFNKLLEQYRLEDAGEIEAEEKSKPMTPKELRLKGDSFQSAALRAFAKRAAGDEIEVNLADLDTQIAKSEELRTKLAERLDRIPTGQHKFDVRTFCGQLAANNTDGAISMLDKLFTPPAPVQVPSKS